ncbi:Transposon Ty3-G Gag-Pol polyprotein [Labeo rohita]|uniref:Transposon Ty3-G Gag-Pol polyprotein n=1 Tax=Labeo rohita TaxID=84645 RepID=A0ABQ8LZ90_LABRO|nr:Transposon Ty3-G Gag-Pol polyprotein [Labeo rohita]
MFGRGACGGRSRGKGFAHTACTSPWLHCAQEGLSSLMELLLLCPVVQVPLPLRRTGACTHGDQLDLMEGMETGDPLSPSQYRSVSASGTEAPLVVTFPRDQPSTRHSSSSEEVDVVSVDSQTLPQSPRYDELLEVVTRAVERLNLDWPEANLVDLPASRLDERFLRSQAAPSRRSLPFFPDLHTEVCRSWKNPFSARLYIPASDYYGNVAGLTEKGYKRMPPVEQALASHLSSVETSSLKAPSLPTKPLRVTSGEGWGRGMPQQGRLAYQADLLRELSEREHMSADLSLRATRETARAIGRSMASLVAAERHLLLTLSDVRLQDRVCLMDAPLAPSGLFGEVVNTKGIKRHANSRRLFNLSSHGARWLKGLLAKNSRPLKLLPPTEVVKNTAWLLVCPREARLSLGCVSVEPGCVLPPRGLHQRYIQAPCGEPGGLEQPLLFPPETSLERLVPLVEYLAMWLRLPSISQWVLSTIKSGYWIQFKHQPPAFNSVLTTEVGSAQALVLEQEVTTLLSKGAIELVPPLQRESGFYSRYFVVPKKDGGLRPILDLRLLNRSVSQLKFRMLALRQIVLQIRSEDWFVTIGLKNAYFHVAIHPSHRKFRRFAFGGEAYQYRVLPFNDWLIPGQSQSEVGRHRDTVLTHLEQLGLRLNVKKSVLSPVQRTTYLGIVWDSVTMRARLSYRVLLTAVRRVRDGQSLTVIFFQGLLGLMAAASSVMQTPAVVAQKQKVFPEGESFAYDQGLPLSTSLGYVEKPGISEFRPVLGTPCRRVTLTADVSLTGWGALMSGRPAQGLWDDSHRHLHIYCLEMLVVFQALRCFLPDLKHRHVLVCIDNMATVSYIVRQGGQTALAEGSLHPWAAKYGSRHPVETGAEFRGMETASRCRAANLDGLLSSRGRPLRDSGECAMSPLVLSSSSSSSSSSGAGRYGTDLAEASSVRLSPGGSAPRSSGKSPPGCGQPTASSAILAGPSLVYEPNFPPRRLSVGDSDQEGPSLSGRGLGLAHSPRVVEPVGLASEGAQLIASGLSAEVVQTILQSRAPSTRKLYALRWKLFTSWCTSRQQDPVNCPIGTVLEFLQARLATGLSHSTLKVYVAAISAFHSPLDGHSVGRDPLVVRFLRGALRLRPLVRSRVPTWDLAVVLDSLCRAPFEPLDQVSDRLLTIKTAVLLALASLKRVGDLQALSVAPSCIDFAPGLEHFYILCVFRSPLADGSQSSFNWRCGSFESLLGRCLGSGHLQSSRVVFPVDLRQERDTVSLATPTASLPALASLMGLDWCVGTCLLSWSMTSPAGGVSFGLIAQQIQSVVTLEAFPKRFDAVSRSFKEPGLYS